MNLFGRKKNNVKKINPCEAIETLRNALSTMEKREAFLEKQNLGLKKEAKSILRVNKQRAIYLLKKSKLYEKQLGNIFNTKMNIEIQIATLSQASMNMETINALSYGRDALVSAEATMNVDKVAETMDDIEEKMASADEISDVMARPLNQTEDVDDLLKELEDEIYIETTHELTTPVDTRKLPVLPDLPKVPVKNPLTLDEDEQRELRELEILMNS